MVEQLPVLLLAARGSMVKTVCKFQSSLTERKKINDGSSEVWLGG